MVIKYKKSSYILIAVALFVMLNCNSCRKKTDNEVNSREYIAEDNAVIESTQESEINETDTDESDIMNHPENWSFNDFNTYTRIFYEIYREDKTDGLKDERFKIADEFRNNFIPINSIPNRANDEYPVEFEGDSQMCKNHRFYMNSQSDKQSIIRRHLVEFSLNVKEELNNIKVLNSETIYDAYQQEKDSYPNFLNDLEEYKSVIPLLFEEYGYDDDESAWKLYHFCYTENFIKNYYKNNKYIIDKDEYGKDDWYLCSAEENNKYTDLNSKVIGITLKYTRPRLSTEKETYYYRNIMVYFEVDDRSFLDSITKVEEVLEDGTTVEIENNFGK